jgi:hypothetical protein
MNATLERISFLDEHELKSMHKKAVIRLKPFEKNADKNIYLERDIRHPLLSVKGGKTTATYGEAYVQINTKIESSKLL